MFDFQKLQVYQKAREFSKKVFELLQSGNFDRVTNDQLRRASFSIMLNIAEGFSRFSNRDRKNFLGIARGSAFECVAILEFLQEMNQISGEEYSHFLKTLDEISRMLFGLIKKIDDTTVNISSFQPSILGCLWLHIHIYFHPCYL